jgi:alpha-L-fucosidase
VYDFHRFEKIAAQLQPNAVIFSDIGPGCRWAGNERGLILTETNWCTLDTAGFKRGDGGPPVDTLNQGNVRGAHWIPAECDVSIRPGWFYHPEEDQKVKSPDELFDIYLNSVGKGANLILNVPPDRRGRIHEQDSAALVALGNRIKTGFQRNLLLGNTGRLTDGDRATGHEVAVGKAISFDLGRNQPFHMVVLREYLPEGQHVQSFKVEVKKGKEWVEIARSTTIGARKILTIPSQKARQIRVTVLSSNAPAAWLSEVEVY